MVPYEVHAIIQYKNACAVYSITPYVAIYALSRNVKVSRQVRTVRHRSLPRSNHDLLVVIKRSISRRNPIFLNPELRSHNSAHLHGSVRQMSSAPCVRLRQPVHPARRKPRAVLVLRREGDVATALAAAAHGDACGKRVLAWGHGP